jgi:hypothetical protein
MYPGGLEPPLAKTVLVKSLIVKMGPPGRFTIPIHPEKRGEGRRVRGPTSVGVVGGETGKQIRKQIGKFNRRLTLSSKWKMCASRPRGYKCRYTSFQRLKSRRRSEHVRCNGLLVQALLLVEVLGVKVPKMFF